MTLLTAKSSIKAKASLRSTLVMQTSTLSSILTLQPVSTLAIPGIVSVCLLGTRTEWTVNTPWTITSTGVSLAGSAFSVGSPTFAAWALLIGTGTGKITISDGSSQAVFTVATGV